MPLTEKATTVLIAEDNAQLQRLFTKVLTAAGHTVTSIAQGDAVVSAVEEQRPDVLILDLGLPGADGAAILSTIRKNTDLSLHVILVTGNLLDAQDPLIQLADRYLQKPVSIGDLLASVAAFDA